MQNLYAPPQSNLDLPNSPSPPKPRAVSLLQAIGYLAFTVALLGVIAVFFQSFDPYRQPVSPSATLLKLGIFFAMALALATMLFLVRRRHRVSRLLGTVFIALAGVLTIVLFFKLRHTVWSEDLAAWNAVAIAFVAAFFYWSYSFGFSRKACAYFEFRPGS